MSFPKYPKYKPSGVEWLGEVPEHWGVTALKRGYSVTLGKMLQTESSNPDDELLPYLRAANIQWDGVDTTDIKQMWFSEWDRAQLRLERGDLLVSEGGDVGRSCLWTAELDDCYFQNSVNRVRARDGRSNRYLCYWMSTIKGKGYVDVLCNKSTIAHFTAEKVAAVPVPFPPVAEQSKIASFLDRETSKIDALVVEQRRLIELLKEKRQAVISHAVTKGLNPNAPLKPSGIEWLGEVPAHWRVLPLHRIVQERRRITYGIVQPGEPDQFGRFMVRNQDYTNGWSDADKIFRVSDAVEVPYRRARLKAHDLIMTIVGAGTGNVGVVPEWLDGANTTQNIARIAIDSTKADATYIAAVLQGPIGKRSIELFAKGAAQPSLNLEHVRIFPVTVPPLAEQCEIALFIESQSSRLDALTSEAERGIELLQERRTALISAAVTGKIDVRRIAPSIT